MKDGHSGPNQGRWRENRPAFIVVRTYVEPPDPARRGSKSREACGSRVPTPHRNLYYGAALLRSFTMTTQTQFASCSHKVPHQQTGMLVNEDRPGPRSEHNMCRQENRISEIITAQLCYPVQSSIIGAGNIEGWPETSNACQNRVSEGSPVICNLYRA